MNWYVVRTWHHMQSRHPYPGVWGGGISCMQPHVVGKTSRWYTQLLRKCSQFCIQITTQMVKGTPIITMGWDRYLKRPINQPRQALRLIPRNGKRGYVCLGIHWVPNVNLRWSLEILFDCALNLCFNASFFFPVTRCSPWWYVTGKSRWHIATIEIGKKTLFGILHL